MILVILGTQDKPFERILKQIEKEKINGNIKDKIIAQIGCTNFHSDYIETFDFIPEEELNKYIEKANLVISHGGVGTIIGCLDKEKRVIVIPRLKKYKEHTNDHQLQIVKEFERNEYIIPLYNEKKLMDAIEKSKKFKVKKYESNQERFANNLKNYINNL